MQERKTKEYSIFFGSSIVDFASERVELAAFIDSVNDIIRGYGVRISPFFCESLDPSMREGGTQMEIDNALKTCDFAFFLFNNRAGAFTIGELKLAHAQLKKNKKNPLTYVFFKDPPTKPVEPSLAECKSWLENDAKHYYSTFQLLNNVEFYLLTALKSTPELETLEIAGLDKITVDGKEIEGFTTNGLTLFTANQLIREYSASLKDKERAYENLIPLVANKTASPQQESEYIELKTAILSLREQLNHQEEQLYKASRQLVAAAGLGDMTEKERLAWKWMEQGDPKNALEELDVDGLSSDYERIKKRTQEQASRFIHGLRAGITFASAINRFDLAKEYYEKATRAAEEQRVELNIFSEYIVFSSQQNLPNMVDICERFIWIFDGLKKFHPEDIPEHLHATLLNNTGIVFFQSPSMQERARELLQRAVEIWEPLSKSDSTTLDELASAYSNLSIVHKNLNHYAEAEECALHAIEILEKAPAVNPEKLLITLSGAYVNLGYLYLDTDTAKARDFFHKAIEKMSLLTDESSPENLDVLAAAYSTLGVLYTSRDDEEKAQEYCLKAIAILEDLAKDNPDRYALQLANMYHLVASAYQNDEDTTVMEEYYQKAIGILESITVNADRVWPMLSLSYKGYADLKEYEGEDERAIEYNIKAKNILEKLYAINPEQHVELLLLVYDSLAEIYDGYGHDRAEEYYLKAIEIREKLCKENSLDCLSELANAYNNLGILYHDQEPDMNGEKAEEYYLKAINAYETLEKQNSEEYKKMLFSTYNNIALLYQDLGDTQKAEEYSKKKDSL